jgi:hypothetical protein
MVVPAGEVLPAIAAALDEWEATVAAQVVEGPDRPVAVLDNQKGTRPDRRSEIRAGAAELFNGADQSPASIEQTATLAIQQGG